MTANERMKSRMRRSGWYALAFSVVAHLGAFSLSPKGVVHLPQLGEMWGDFQEVAIVSDLSLPESPVSRTVPQIEPISVPALDLPVFSLVNHLMPDLPQISLNAPSSPMTPGLLPLLLNPEECEAALRARFPDALSAMEIAGETLLGVFIAETGRVEMVQISESSGYPELDQIARDVVGDIARFRAATDAAGRPISVWIGVPMGFESLAETR